MVAAVFSITLAPFTNSPLEAPYNPKKLDAISIVFKRSS